MDILQVMSHGRLSEICWIVLNTANGELYYSIARSAAIFLAAVVTFYAGIARGYQKSTWSLIILTGLIFYVLGEKLTTYSPDQWVSIFTGFDFPVTRRRTYLGGVIGLTFGLLLAKTWLRFKQPVMDNYAIALPLSMSVSRIGCLSAGCCFGTPTTLPWGIRYSSHTLAFQTHQMKGLIGTEDHFSLPIHPVQFYELAGCLIISWVVWRTRKQWKVSGDLFLFSALCYALLRFLVEFFRDPFSNLMLADSFHGLKGIQVVLLFVMVACLITLVVREKRNRPSPVGLPDLKTAPLRELLLVACMTAIVVAGKNWFTQNELKTILIYLIPVSALILATNAGILYRHYQSKSFRQ